MNIKEIVNVSRYLDNIFITSLSNIVLDYIISNTECSSCDRKFDYINDYPYFRILSVNISGDYPKYIRDHNHQYIQKDEVDKIKNFIEFREKYGKKLKSFYDPVSNLIYDDSKYLYLNVRKNVSDQENIKILYEKSFNIEQKRLQPYKDMIGITLKNRELNKYLNLPFNPYDRGGYDTYTDFNLSDKIRMHYSLQVREENVFKFVGFVSGGHSSYGRIDDFSEIILEGIY